MKDSRYSIGVVTYHARYDKYFKPLIEKLVKIFPDHEILCVINGHPDTSLQASYLQKVTSYLSGFSNVRYMTHNNHQSLAQCWNELIYLSFTEKILIMNDDTQVTELFRQEFEGKVLPKNFSTINYSWSHFLFSKNIIPEVGWFDERLLGVGHEDADYRLRMAMIGLEATDTDCLGLRNYVVDQENPGWKDISKKVSNHKYSQINHEIFMEQWITQDGDPEIKLEDFKYKVLLKGGYYHFSPRNEMPVPLFYDYSILNTTVDEKKSDISVSYKKSSKIFFQKIFYSLRNIAKIIYRKIRY